MGAEEGADGLVPGQRFIKLAGPKGECGSLNATSLRHETPKNEVITCFIWR